MSKYNLHDTAYVFNLFAPLVAEFKIKGLIEHEGTIYYTCDEKTWVKEEYLHETKEIAYLELSHQVQQELGDNAVSEINVKEEF